MVWASRACFSSPVGLGDELADVLLLGSYRLERRDGRPAALVGGHEVVDQLGGRAATALGRAQRIGVVAQKSGIDHAISLGRVAPDGETRPGRRRRPDRPE